MNKKQQNSLKKVKPPELIINKELKAEVQNMMDTESKDGTPYFWENGFCRSFYVPVDDGEIKVYHIKPPKIASKRPVVFIPGWGGLKEHFQDYYKPIHNKVELYYVETREKNSSRVNRKKVKMNMSQKAKDIQEVIEFLNLDKEDFVLHGTCWGSAIVLQGLMDKRIKAPTVVVHDPMHKLWFPKWIIKYIAPILPAFGVKLMRPFFKWMQLRGMEEKVQRERAEFFIKRAELWKWRKAAIAVKDFELFGNLSKIEETVFVSNGTFDKVHNRFDYPKIATELPNGRFIYMETDEAQREKLIGLIALEFSKISKEQGIPPSLMKFEKQLTRNN